MNAFEVGKAGIVTFLIRLIYYESDLEFRLTYPLCDRSRIYMTLAGSTPGAFQHTRSSGSCWSRLTKAGLSRLPPLIGAFEVMARLSSNGL